MACDWIIDMLGRVHLLECNGFPFQDLLGMKRKTSDLVWHEMMALVLDLNLDPGHIFSQSDWKQDVARKGVWQSGPPSGISGIKFEKGFRYGNWHMIYSELQTPMKEYNACNMEEVDVVD